LNTKELLAKLCEPFGGSGSEKGINDVICGILEGYKTATDAMGNLGVEIVPKRADRPVVMLTAHTDEISFIVNEVRGDGTLSLGTVGGIDRRTLHGAKIAVHTKDGEITGVITSGENETSPKDNITAEIGYKKDDSPVRQGDRAGFIAPVFELSNDVLCGHALDDRIGCAVIIKAAQNLAKNLNIGVYLLFAVQEEIGCRGSGAGTHNIMPDIAIAIDGSFGENPIADSSKTGKSGEGPMIGVSPILSQKHTDGLIIEAKTRKIPYQLEIMGGGTGTDSDRITFTDGGVETALVSVPMRNMHTAVETVLVSDIDKSAKLIAAYINTLGGAANV